jgi:hypothetical protein
MLVGTDIAQSGDLAVLPYQANRVTSRSHALQNASLGKLSERGNGLKRRFFVCSNEWKTARCAHF